jgi:hypothetical protein
MALWCHPSSSGGLQISQDCEIVVIRVGTALTRGDEQLAGRGSDIVNTISLERDPKVDKRVI